MAAHIKLLGTSFRLIRPVGMHVDAVTSACLQPLAGRIYTNFRTKVSYSKVFGRSFSNSDAVGVSVLLFHFRTRLASVRSRDILENVDRCSRSSRNWICRVNEWFIDYCFILGSSS
jgi:hypothetical protein